MRAELEMQGEVEIPAELPAEIPAFIPVQNCLKSELVGINLWQNWVEFVGFVVPQMGGPFLPRPRQGWRGRRGDPRVNLDILFSLCPPFILFQYEI